MGLGDFQPVSELRLRLMNLETTEGYNGPSVHMFGRDEAGKYHHIEVTDHRPSFFIHINSYDPSIENHTSVEYTEKGYTSIKGESLVRIYTTSEKSVKSMRDMYDRTWEADVWFRNRFLLDKNIYTGFKIDMSQKRDSYTADFAVPTKAVSACSPPTVDARVVTVDIEVHSEDGFPKATEARWPVISIVANDSYTNEQKTWVLRSDEWNEDPSNGIIFDSEAVMLNDFNHWLGDIQPDVLTGWYSNSFDYPYLINRCRNISVTSTAAWSPLGDVWVTRRWKEPAVKGVTCFDMLEGYEKLQIHKLQKRGLNDIAKKEGVEEKLDIDGYGRVWMNDPEKFLDYNRRDVDAVIAIEEKKAIMDTFMNFRDVTGALLSDTPTRNFDMIDMLTLHKAKESGVVLPTSVKPDEDWFFGAYVFQPMAGLHEHVVYPDLSSLYPNMMAQCNMSPETIIGTRTDLFMSEYNEADCLWSYVDIRPVKRVERSEDYSEYKDGSFKAVMRRTKSGGWKKVWSDDPKPVKMYYLKPEIKQGFVAGMIDDLLTMKAEYKNPSVARTLYEAVKRVVNSCYGVFGDSATFGRGFRLFDWRMAESITLGGRFIVKESARTFVDALNNIKDTVSLEGDDAYLIGGDTDSVMTAIPFVRDGEQANTFALQAAASVNRDYDEYVYEMFGVEKHRMEIEVESYSPKCFFVQDTKKDDGVAVKKRYVTMMTYKDGRKIDEPKLNVKGFEMIRSDVAQITQEAQRELFNLIMTHDPEEAKKRFYEYLRTTTRAIETGQFDMNKLGVKFGMSKKATSYGSKNRSPMPQFRGAKYANEYIYKSEAIDTQVDAMYYYVDDTGMYPRTYTAKTAENGRDVDAISVLDANDIPEEISVDVDLMLEKTLINPLKPILHTLGWSYYEAVSETNAAKFM